MTGGSEVAAVPLAPPLDRLASLGLGLPLEWTMLLALAAVDSLWCCGAGLRFEHGWPQALGVLGLALLAALYRRSGRNARIADACEIAALWLGFSISACILTYLCATPALPLHDAAYARADLALGFDWQGWKAWVGGRPWFELLLAVAYASFMAQLLASILYFAFTGRGARNSELYRAAFAGLLVTAAVSGLWPALSAFVRYGLPAQAPYLHDLVALRSGQAMVFSLAALQGIVTFPSYHAVLGLLVAYAHRRSGRWLAGLALGWNLLILLSIPSEGGHYAVDVLGGFAVALPALWLATASLRREGQPPRRADIAQGRRVAR